MNLKFILGTIIFCWSGFAAAVEDSNPATEEEQLIAWASKTWNSINKQTGQITISEAKAVLNVPDDFIYLNPKDTETVLSEIWGNPPGQKTLGMLMPANMTPFDNASWAVTVEYEEDGYVSDADADEIDYSDLLSQMKKDTAEASKSRIQQGYGSIELIGWAAPPYYDVNNKKLHWAKELKFNAHEVNTLNYNIRVLGRKGVLVLNFIAGMDQKPVIDSKIDSVLAMAEFQAGAQYSDFDPNIDEVAAYGLGALVAGKVMAKTGFLALALVFIKKFWVFILVGIGALFKALFSRKTGEQAVEQTDSNDTAK